MVGESAMLVQLLKVALLDLKLHHHFTIYCLDPKVPTKVLVCPRMIVKVLLLRGNINKRSLIPLY